MTRRRGAPSSGGPAPIARPPAPDGTDRGAGSVLSAGVVLVVCFAMVVGAWVAGWVGQVHRARGAADLAALAGAQAHASGGDACAAARASAPRNGATVLDCHVEGRPGHFLVRVEAGVRLQPDPTRSGTMATARAVAGRVGEG